MEQPTPKYPQACCLIGKTIMVPINPILVAVQTPQRVTPLPCDYLAKMQQACTAANQQALDYKRTQNPNFNEILFEEDAFKRMWFLTWCIGQVIEKNYERATSEPLTNFHELDEEGRCCYTPIATYMLEAINKLMCPESCYILATIYVDKYIHQNNFNLSSSTFHYFFSTALLISMKMTEDISWTNQHFATVCQIPLQKLNELEIAFLNHIETILIDKETYQQYYDTLNSHYTKVIST